MSHVKLAQHDLPFGCQALIKDDLLILKFTPVELLPMKNCIQLLSVFLRSINDLHHWRFVLIFLLVFVATVMVLAPSVLDALSGHTSVAEAIQIVGEVVKLS